MREKATRIDPGGGIVVDTCGTGGTAKGTFNISTTAAFVVAGAGVKVAKHGNRTFTRASGSADVLAALGVNLDAPVPMVERCIREARIGFLFAPALHAAMRYAIGPRKELGVRTIFNILGPLTSPASVRHQLMGVGLPGMAQKLAEVLGKLGSTHCMVVRGEDGLDEVTTTGATEIAQLSGGQVEMKTICPEDVGLSRAHIEQLVVNSPEEAADVTRKVLGGEGGPARDIVLMNAAAALLVADVVSEWPEAIEKAAQSIDTGAANEALGKLIEISNQPD